MLLSIKQKMISVNLPNLPVGKERLDEVLPDEVCSLGVWPALQSLQRVESEAQEGGGEDQSVCQDSDMGKGRAAALTIVDLLQQTGGQTFTREYPVQHSVEVVRDRT